LLAIIGAGYFYLNSEKNRDLCDCVKAGELANELSASFFNRMHTEQGKDSLDQLIAYRDSICAPFLEVSVEELHKAAKDCPQLNIDPSN
jgi:hypothetical protein